MKLSQDTRAAGKAARHQVKVDRLVAQYEGGDMQHDNTLPTKVEVGLWVLFMLAFASGGALIEFEPWGLDIFSWAGYVIVIVMAIAGALIIGNRIQHMVNNTVDRRLQDRE